MVLGIGLVISTSNAEIDHLKPLSESNLDLNLPKDCKIIGVSPQREKVFIIIDGASICDRVIVVDTRLGIIVGTIMARP